MLTIESIADPAYLCLAAKKARKYLLSRQWYHDRASQEAFCGALTFRAWQLAEEIRTETYQPQRKVVFAAPKKVTKEGGVERFTFRPLAIQKFRDEVVETALVMTLADRFEREWGDPEKDEFPKLCSYGNRIHRSQTEQGLVLPLGSSHLYRDWPEDYSKFVKSTASAFNAALNTCGARDYVLLFSSDISNFFPCVNRGVLIDRILSHDLDPAFARLVDRVFGAYDVVACENTREQADSLRHSGLLQGPVHSGFWANVYLSTFDAWVRERLAGALAAIGITASLAFYGRYVDDFHIVFKLKHPTDGDLEEAHLKNVIKRCLESELHSLGLQLSAAKTSTLLQDSLGGLLTTGQVADRMAALTRKAYFPLPPEELADLEAELRLLFGSRADQVDDRATALPSQGPVLDNPGVRDQSRKRFAAGKWLRVARDLDRIQPGWLDKNNSFAGELLREWLYDPTQIQLLQRAFEVGLRPADVRMFIIRLNALKNKASRPFYDFVWSYLLHLSVYQKKNWGFAYNTIADDAINAGTHPVLVQQALAWKLKCKRAVSIAETKLAPSIAGDYGLCRRVLWNYVSLGSKLSPFELGAIFCSVRPSDRVLKSLTSKALALLHPPSRPQLLRSVLLRRARPIFELSRSWNIDVPELQAFEGPSSRPRDSKDSCLFIEILAGKYRSPIKWLGLAKELGLLLQDESIQIQAKRGMVHPFSLVRFPDQSLQLVSEPAVLTAFSSGAEARDNPAGGWTYAVGLILRAAATGNPVDLLGASPISRFSMAGTFLWLATRGARLGSQAANLLDRLAWWPGSRLTPFGDIEEYLASVEFLISETAATALHDVVLSDIHLQTEAKKLTSTHCIALCQLRAAPSKVSDASVRRALSITRSILRERETDDSALNLVVFPEMSVPRASIGTLCKFSRITGCVVLAGLELIKDPKAACHRNELVWIVPMDTRSGRVAVLRQEKIFPTAAERRLRPPVRAAVPPVVWRLKSGRDRLAAINCYEFTYLPLRELLRGRVELMVVSANNQDVTTFDNLIESTHYDLYSHVVLVNSEKHGGSAIRAPYREAHERRIFDIHGADLFSVNVCFADLGAFRGPVSRRIKSRPAGFKVQ